MGSEMDTTDSRKRPLDGETETGVTKRSNPGGPDNVHFKVLIPSIAAGAIIGKGGETIAQKQKETGARIKMSKATDFYPGTSERVCLVTGTVEAISTIHNFIMEKIYEKPDPNPKPVEGELKVNLERHKQVKIMVPNSTAGMIIGKGGNFIKLIKEGSGSYVQISQKSKDVNLPERCVTISGELEGNKKAVSLILQKISEDPQSASCPNISYADVTGPVASSNPTGSPFASGSTQNQGRDSTTSTQPPDMSQMQSAQPMMQPQPGQPQPVNSCQPGPISMGPAGMGQPMFAGMNNLSVENLKATLRGSGYSEQATEDISAAMCTLANYGFLGMGMGIGQQQGFSLNLGGGTGLGALNLGGNHFGSMSGPDTGGLFGPVGSGSSMGGGSAGSSLFSNASATTGHAHAHDGTAMFQDYGFAQGYGPSEPLINQNSFGLGPGMGGNYPGQHGEMIDKDAPMKKEMEVSDGLVGVILGKSGKAIVELQSMTQANIQISKKGVYAPGTRNRIVTITGTADHVHQAYQIIQNKIGQVESRRSRQMIQHQGQMPPPAPPVAPTGPSLVPQQAR